MSQNPKTVIALLIKLKHVPDGAAVSMPGGIEVMTVQHRSTELGGDAPEDRQPVMNHSPALFHAPTKTYHHGNPESEVLWHVQRHEKRVMYQILYTPEIETKPLWSVDSPVGELVKY